MTNDTLPDEVEQGLSILYYVAPRLCDAVKSHIRELEQAYPAPLPGEVERLKRLLDATGAYCGVASLLGEFAGKEADARLQADALRAENARLVGEVSRLTGAVGNVRNHERERYADALMAQAEQIKRLREVLAWYVETDEFYIFMSAEDTWPECAEDEAWDSAVDAYEVLKEASHD